MIFGTPDELNFEIRADDTDFLAALKRDVAEIKRAENEAAAATIRQRLALKDYAKEAQGYIDARNAQSASPLASDRKINKAFGQNTVGDFLEGMGITEQGLARIKTAGMTIFALQGAMSSLSKVMDGISSGQSASQIFTEIAKSIPIIGGAAAAAEKFGESLANYAYATKSTIETSRLINASIDANRQAFENAEKAVKNYGKTMQDAMDRQELANAKPEERDAIAAKQKARNEKNSLNDTLESDIEAARKSMEARNLELSKQREKVIAEADAKNSTINKASKYASFGIVDRTATADTAGIDSQIAANKKAFEQAERQMREAAGTAAKEVEKANAAEQEKIKRESAEKAAKERLDIDKKLAQDTAKWEEDFWDDVNREETKKAEEKAKREAEINKQQMLGSAELLQEIDASKTRIADEEQRRARDIASNTRTGALAATFGLGTSNQLASKERASASIQITIAKDSLEVEKKQLAALEKLAAMAELGEVTPIFLN